MIQFLDGQKLTQIFRHSNAMSSSVLMKTPQKKTKCLLLKPRLSISVSWFRWGSRPLRSIPTVIATEF